MSGSLSSRVVSVLDSGAEGPRFKLQPRRCQVTVLGKLFTPIVPLFTKHAAKLVATLLRVAGVTADLAESNVNLPPGLWLASRAGCLPRTGISAWILHSIIEYGLPLPFNERVMELVLWCADNGGNVRHHEGMLVQDAGRSSVGISHQEIPDEDRVVRGAENHSRQWYLRGDWKFSTCQGVWLAAFITLQHCVSEKKGFRHFLVEQLFLDYNDIWQECFTECG